jgi:HAD superfamily hydrolase (TIGR01549 family)
MKVLFFDMYQTLVDTEVSGDKDIEHNAHKTVFADFLMQKEVKEDVANTFESQYERMRDEFYQDHNKKTEHHDFKKLVDQTFRQCYGVNVDDKALSGLVWKYRKLVRGTTKLYDGVKETLEVLSKEYSIFLASYTQASYSLLELEELGIKQYFKGFIFSSDIGYRKMSDEFYKKCIEVSGTEAANCVMIGDNKTEDVYMSKKNGMKAIWIKNPASMHGPSAFEVTPDAELETKDFAQLPEILARI